MKLVLAFICAASAQLTHTSEITIDGTINKPWLITTSDPEPSATNSLSRATQLVRDAYEKEICDKFVEKFDTGTPKTMPAADCEATMRLVYS